MTKKCGHSAREFFRAGRIIQLHVIELQPATHKVHMSIIKPGQKQFARGINRTRFGTSPRLDISVGTDRHNAISQHSDGLCCRQNLVLRHDLGIGDNEISAP